MSRLFAGTPFDRPPVCERCGQPEADCDCPPPVTEPARIPPELVTVIRGLSASGNDLPALLTRLKSRCGSGGTLDGDTIELQGDHLAKLKTLLGELGYKTR
jgi:translation initiation factor 1